MHYSPNFLRVSQLSPSLKGPSSQFHPNRFKFWRVYAKKPRIMFSVLLGLGSIRATFQG